MIKLKFLIMFMIVAVAVIIIVASLFCIVFSKSRTKSDYDKNLEDDEQMNYIKKK